MFTSAHSKTLVCKTKNDIYGNNKAEKHLMKKKRKKYNTLQKQSNILSFLIMNFQEQTKLYTDEFLKISKYIPKV